MLKYRLITAAWGLPLVIAAIWFDEPLPWFTLLVAVWAAMAVFEFYRLAASAQHPGLPWVGVVLTLAFVASADTHVQSFVSPGLNGAAAGMLLLSAATVLPLVWLLRGKDRSGAFNRWAWTLAGVAYIGGLSSFLVATRGLDDGRNWVFLALLCTFASDTAAYFYGRAFGRHKMAPAISPGKSWEGAVAGLIGAMAASLIFLPDTYCGATNALRLPLSYWSAPLLGLLVSLFGQLGDLVESLFKRNMDAKDSGRLLAGHGGALDRIDSVVFAGVVVYYYVIWAVR
jgi:phosphatidate cytidylyltransferase